MARKTRLTSQIPNDVVLKFVGGPMDGEYPGGVDYPNNVGLLLHGYYERTGQGKVGATVQPMSPVGIQSNFKPEYLRIEGMRTGKYIVLSNDEVDGRRVIKIKYEGIGGHPDAE
jgi:hypothetical protein